MLLKPTSLNHLSSKPIYLPGLNGLRAIAALSVVFSHITLGLKSFNLDPFLFGAYTDGTPKGLSLASFGVTIFFSLSGFLITFLLLKEKELQEINVKHFYLRRILRIWPLYYLYLILALVFTFAAGEFFNLNSLLCYVFYLANVPFILNTTIPLLTHYWSLGVEEQFYVFWPWFVKKIKNKLELVVFALIVLLIGLKLFLHIFHPGSIAESAIHVSRFHCMLVGALGAILYNHGNKLFLWLTDNKFTQALCLLILISLLFNKFHVVSVLDNEIISVVALCLIVGQINVKNRLVNFDLGIFDFLGKISYGIYVIHPLIIFTMYTYLFPHVNIEGMARYILVYSSGFLLTIFVSWLSYTYFEKYFLKLKEKVTAVRSSGTKYFS